MHYVMHYVLHYVMHYDGRPPGHLNPGPHGVPHVMHYVMHYVMRYVMHCVMHYVLHEGVPHLRYQRALLHPTPILTSPHCTPSHTAPFTVHPPYGRYIYKRPC